MRVRTPEQLARHTAYMKCYRATHEVYRLRAIKRQSERAKKLRSQVLDHYGRFCRCCGETEEHFLTIDHINGGGCQHRKTIKGGQIFHTWLIKHKFPLEFQILCMNCNWAKGKYGHCPHREMDRARAN